MDGVDASRRRVVILGSTGSIGRQAIEVARAHPDRFEIVALVAGRDAAAVQQQADELGVKVTGLGRADARALASLDEADVVLNGIVGAAGLEASVAALAAGKTLALANKESLVCGGEVCLDAARRGGGAIVPVDSEHAAIATCLEGRDGRSVARIFLTASGGPFRTRSDLSAVTVSDALAHPTWSMGPKITIDSATLMNKALEVIEAHHLFGFGYDSIGVVVHPQSAVHGIVQFADGSLLMHAAPADMRIPIQAALAGQVLASPARPLDLAAQGTLTFEDVDHARFPAVSLGYDAGRAGQSYPTVLNAANEVAVGAFLAEHIAFTEIVPAVQRVLDVHDPVPVSDLEVVLEVDAWARRAAGQETQGALAPAGGRA